MVEPTTPSLTRRRPSTTRLISSGVVALAGGLVVGSIILIGITGGPATRSVVLPATDASVGHQGTSSGHVNLPTVPRTTAPPSPSKSPRIVPAATPSARVVVPASPPTTGVPPTVPPTVQPTLPAPVPASPPPTPPPVASGPTASSVADVAALVSQVEAAGIAPGETWTWSIGTTSRCGAIPGTNVGTGCTAGMPGSVTTVFTGVPGLLLVAHELANAATENYAVPALVHLVTQSEGGTSWSPIDAVATCLVAHFMHAQDGAAGTWSCPAPLADIVAAHIRDTKFAG